MSRATGNSGSKGRYVRKYLLAGASAIALLVGSGQGNAAVLGLGAFPPDPKTQQILKTLPNDKFGRPN